MSGAEAEEWFFARNNPDERADSHGLDLNTWSSGWLSRGEIIEEIRLVGDTGDFYICPGKPYEMGRLLEDAFLDELLDYNIVGTLENSLMEKYEALCGSGGLFVIEDKVAAKQALREYVRCYIRLEEDIYEPDLSHIEKITARDGQVIEPQKAAK